jgi:AraC-like DNA-binding protein
MRTDIAFDAEDGTTLRGWLYVPDGGGPRPTVVMAHGFSAVKEQTLEDLAEVLVAQGLACVVYDHRNLGASDGTPRQDEDRIGIFGSSYSGAHVLVAQQIADDFAMSVRALHALFADTDDTVAAYVRRRRLVRARSDLLRSPWPTVTDVAHRWSFSDAANFSRAFRAQYGETPSAAQRAARAAAGSTSGT